MGLRRRILLTALEGGYWASLLRPWRRFVRQAVRAEATQAEKLKTLLRQNCAYARTHKFSTISTITEYQDKVPVVTYQDLSPWVDKIAAGEKEVLTQAPVKLLERTSGSTGGNKLIPYTQGLLDEFSAATGPWLFSLYRRHPGLLGTTSYWSLSPVTQGPQKTSGGLSIGIEDDTEYFDPLSAWALQKMLSVPQTVKKLTDLEVWRLTTARHLLADPALGFISVWSPSFLTLLFEAIQSHWDTLLAQLPPGRARSLRRLNRFIPQEVWPRLQVVSCWTDGQAGSVLPALKHFLEEIKIQPKGLLATEGVVSFPLSLAEPLPGPVAAVGGPFLEFIDLEAPQKRPALLTELRKDATYSPLLSTAGGFYRYALRDVVRCVGHWGALPCLRFEGKLDRTCDLVGEKLSAPEVEAAFQRLGISGFALLCPAQPPHYRLYVEPAELHLADRLDKILSESHHYGYARKLGQLGPVVAVPTQNGWRTYEAALVARGARAGDIKPTPLDNRLFWREVFEGKDGS